MKELLYIPGLLEVPDVDTGSAVVKDTLPPIIDAIDLLSANLPEPTEVVRELLHQGSKLSLAGASKSYKTWSLTDLAYSVSTGAPWLGFETTRGRVLYLNLEIQECFFKRRIEAIQKVKGSELVRGYLDVWNLRGHAAAHWELLPRIQERLLAGNHSLIILDPIYKILGKADENAAGDIAYLMNLIERPAVTTGAAVAFGAHFSKGNQSGKEAIDRVSGSGVFARDPDSILTFTRHKQDGAFTIEPTLRNFAPVQPFVVRWEFPLMRRDDSLDPEKLKLPRGRKPQFTPEDILAVLPESGLKNQEWLQHAMDECGVSKRRFYDLRKELALFPQRAKPFIYRPVTKALTQSQQKLAALVSWHIGESRHSTIFDLPRRLQFGKTDAWALLEGGCFRLMVSG